MKNGTSLPSWWARLINCCFVRFSFRWLFKNRSVVAALLDPPPRPAPMGMFLVRVTVKLQFLVGKFCFIRFIVFIMRLFSGFSCLIIFECFVSVIMRFVLLFGVKVI